MAPGGSDERQSALRRPSTDCLGGDMQGFGCFRWSKVLICSDSQILRHVDLGPCEIVVRAQFLFVAPWSRE
jgi:hypothetical protein